MQLSFSLFQGKPKVVRAQFSFFFFHLDYTNVLSSSKKGRAFLHVPTHKHAPLFIFYTVGNYRDSANPNC
jgi:hypothetical protein